MNPRLAVLLVAPLVALALAGCSQQVTVEARDLEEEISNKVEEMAGQAPDRIDCPGDLEGEEGTVMHCVLHDGEDEHSVTVTVTGVDGTEVDFDIDAPVMLDERDVEQEVSAQLEEMAGQAPDRIDCPGDLEGEEGTEMRCVLHAGQDKLGVTLTVTKVDGTNVDFDIQVDEEVME